MGEKIDLPHVVLNGKASIQNIFEKLEPLFVRDGTEILRTMELYLERNKNAILIDSLAIESDKKTSFLAMITGREDSVVVRLYPKQEIEKTDGVKRTLAEIAKQIVSKFPDFKTAETNLGEYLS
ncbi:MAG TPA: hypothetical protein VF893_03110 [Candidatus Bathyarchaeia archaeon]